MSSTFFIPGGKIKTMYYNDGHDVAPKECVMSKRKIKIKDQGETFGERLARLRQAAGYSQRDLAAELGVSQRMIAYYEKETDYPPSHLLPLLTKALGVTADQLLGLQKVKDNGKSRDTRLWRRFSQVEKLPAAQRKQITQILDAFLEREKLKKGK
jgi:transcriptional regulator with XRE-family HTH domain